jgi:four helix bundle suffix protein
MDYALTKNVDRMDGVDKIGAMRESEKLIPKHGGYRHLKSLQVAQLVYDVTVRFCDRYIDRRSRTRDQMTQAARSGVQNIAEGSQCSGTSKKFELKLTSVARASLEELRLDYEDFLRQRRLPQWPRLDPRRAALIARRPTTADEVSAWAKDVRQRETQVALSTQSIPSTYAEIAANGVLALITVASSLLERQLSSLEKAFVTEGGFTERLHRVRTASRLKAR